MPACAVRRATTSDVPAVAELFDLYRQFYNMPPDPETALRFIRDRIENGESAIFVAETNGEGIVGFCQLYSSFCSVFVGPISILNDLFVLPAARGKGIGAALLEQAEAHARATGAVRINLQTARTNVTAQAMYEALGWSRNETLFGYAKRLQD